MIKNIIFDMGNVLLAYTPKEYIKTITADETIGQAVLRELFYGEEWIQLDAGSITEEEAILRVQSRIPQYNEYVQRAMDDWHSNLTPVEGMPEVVERLKERGYKIYLLSNTSMRFYNYQPKVEMFKFFDGFFISAKERLLKPDKAIFESFLARFCLKASESLFVDDLVVNVKGAESTGIMAHQFCGAYELTEYLKKKEIL
ncbi:MAG: family phosphatase [Clostridia bacterium]|jgi:putative hydrolase of the HAD superfamily|nr:family phosphatase [Clostridia bacterium]